MPPALSSPGFLAALAVLLANDLWWKAAFGNWLTGKLSDFAGLFVVVVLAVALRPAHARALAIVTAAAFVLWKSPASQPLIDAWNTAAPYRIARVVDYSDLLALAMIPLARRYVAVARPIAPAAFRYPVVGLALLAILGTSKAPPVTEPYQQMEHVTFYSEPPIYDVAASRAEVLERLRQADFTVKSGALSTDVEILSGATCTTAPRGRRFVHAQAAVQADRDGSTILLRLVYLCRRDRPWDRQSAAREFETDVLDRLGRWHRQAER
ncbi:MAG: hypothetical protein DMD78_29565 [Candidatus Rokuibacteriota bacterium]|nr:MAG: hypothetical protein DMD78_29565 [Candidatus Rokubacteria bacterium]